MKYREQLINFIIENDPNAMMDWVVKQSLLDQPDILREVKELFQGFDKSGRAGNSLAELDRLIARYEDKILDEKLAEAQLWMALENHEQTLKEMNGTPEGFRAFIIECIVTDAPNAKQMRQVAERMMEFEKKKGTFDIMDWIGIL
ncbi:MAG: hypothetical protein M0D53_04115 [Flavobacterium sp. JAD_PAG50586_2]|nr:MAG: hypothetical protein M0D53_04115 [Flavobacterium sp. JAD_PAG50586_2]